MRIMVIIGAFLAMAFMDISYCFADTIHVPADQPTIQAGIEAAENGDTLVVAPGTYVENISFRGKAIEVVSSHGPASTVIDGGSPSNLYYASTVMFIRDEGPDSVLNGFTVTNGSGTGSFYDREGGGVFCGHGTSPLLLNNTIINNRALEGGGIHCDVQSAPTILCCTLFNNTAPWKGGGINCTLTGYAVICNNRIFGNSAKTGGGLCLTSGNCTVEHNVIVNNTAFDEGGGLYCSGTSIANNLIMYNKVPEGWGGGIYFLSSGSISNNTVVGNEAKWGGGVCMEGDHFNFNNNCVTENSAFTGGGIYFSYFYSTQDSTFTNNTVASNSGEKGGGLYVDLMSWSHPLVITNSIFWDNGLQEISLGFQLSKNTTYFSYSLIQGGIDSIHLEPGSVVDWGAGMIDADPRFIDPASQDHHITYQSPCRDSGTNDAQGITPLDFDGNNRIFQSTIDIGADEFSPHFYTNLGFLPGDSIEGKLIGLPGTNPVGLCLGTSLVDPPLTTPWGLFYLGAPWMYVPLPSIPANGVMIIPETVPASPPGPYEVYGQAFIGDLLTQPYVINVF